MTRPNIVSEGHSVDDCPANASESRSVPNVIGMRACDALPLLVKAGLQPYATLASEVTWRVTGQRPEAGSAVERGGNASLTLEPDDDPKSPLSANCAAAVASNEMRFHRRGEIPALRAPTRSRRPESRRRPRERAWRRRLEHLRTASGVR
jgi:hypothetical protein